MVVFVYVVKTRACEARKVGSSPTDHPKCQWSTGKTPHFRQWPLSSRRWVFESPRYTIVGCRQGDGNSNRSGARPEPGEHVRLAQWLAHFLDMEEAGGSSPPMDTMPT